MVAGTIFHNPTTCYTKCLYMNKIYVFKTNNINENVCKKIKLYMCVYEKKKKLYKLNVCIKNLDTHTIKYSMHIHTGKVYKNMKKARVCTPIDNLEDLCFIIIKKKKRKKIFLLNFCYVVGKHEKF